MDDHNKSNNDCNYQTWNTLILCHNIDIQSSNVFFLSLSFTWEIPKYHLLKETECMIFLPMVWAGKLLGWDMRDQVRLWIGWFPNTKLDATESDENIIRVTGHSVIRLLSESVAVLIPHPFGDPGIFSLLLFSYFFLLFSLLGSSCFITYFF